MREALHALLAPGPSAGNVAFAGARLKELGAAGAKASGLKPLRVYIARSVTVEPFLQNLVVHAALNGFWLDVSLGGYGSFIDDLMNPDGALCRLQPDLTLFLGDIEDLAGGLADVCASGAPAEIDRETTRASRDIAALIEALRRNSKTRLIVQGFVLPDQPALGEIADTNLGGEGRAVARINEAIAEACRGAGDAVFFDQDHLAARHGRKQWRDARMFYASRLAVAPAFFDAYAEGLVRAIRALYLPPRKVVCTDLDNTLWGGIVGEDGPEGVATGAAFPGNCYRAYQRYLKQLAARGVLLAIVSKNNPADVEECFHLRAGDLAVAWNDFVGFKIGWGEKSVALRELAQELSLGLDSFVFVDDNPAECEAVRRELPQVLVIEAPPNQPWRLADAVAEAGAFDSLAITEDDRRRTEEYRAQSRRVELEASTSSREEFLASLEIECTILSALDAPLSRTAQLISKTNQFNLTTRRHSAGDIERFAQRQCGIAAALRLRDRFGDAGVIGVALCAVEGETATIDTFLLSCRVIGRGVETALLANIASRARQFGARSLIGEYVPSAKNQMCKDFFPSHGFTANGQTGENGATIYEFDLNTGSLASPPWIHITAAREAGGVE